MCLLHGFEGICVLHDDPDDIDAYADVNKSSEGGLTQKTPSSGTLVLTHKKTNSTGSARSMSFNGPLETSENRRKKEMKRLEGFKQKLLVGLTVKRHTLDNKPIKGRLVSNSSFDALFFRIGSSTKLSSSIKQKDVTLSLQDILEIRAGIDPDPEFPRYAGTAILRKTCNPMNANKAVSLISTDKTFDLEFSTTRECLETIDCIRLLIALLPDK